MSLKMCYAYAKLSPIDFGIFRFPGVGLGNLLFPWSRFIVASRKYNLIPIEPTWFQIKIGQMFRNETDKRFYHNLFRSPADHIHGLKKLYLLNSLKKVKEAEFRSLFKNGQPIGQNLIIIFEGIEGYFNEILEDHELVLSELLKMTRKRHQNGFNFSRRSIGVHVRLGDFTLPENGQILKQGGINYRIPLSWYVHQIEKIRKTAGRDLAVTIFSDGTNQELSVLLALDNVRRISFGSSIADLLALSRSGVLIASGSTFSMWASYLGRMPVIWHKGQLRQRLYYEDQTLETECDDRGNLPTRFLEALHTRFSRVTANPCVREF